MLGAYTDIGASSPCFLSDRAPGAVLCPPARCRSLRQVRPAAKRRPHRVGRVIFQSRAATTECTGEDLVVDVRAFRDPGATWELKQHDGTNPMILGRLVRNDLFGELVSSMRRDLRPLLRHLDTRDVKVSLVCRAGRHRSLPQKDPHPGYPLFNKKTRLEVGGLRIVVGGGGVARRLAGGGAPLGVPGAGLPRSGLHGVRWRRRAGGPRGASRWVLA